jgi:predicted RNA methylase
MSIAASDVGSCTSAAHADTCDQRVPIDGIDSDLSPANIAASLRAGQYDLDREFDRFLPIKWRAASHWCWTPIRVAARVAAWLDELSIRTLLDIGSGPGKFCIVGAITGGCVFLGLEQRPRLVEVARTLAKLFGVEDRVCFLDATFGEAPVPLADAYYLYNPFGENLSRSEDRLDSEVELNDERYLRDVAATEQMLAEAPVGTVVITYNGFGGTIPLDYREIRVATDLPNILRLSRRV